MAVRAPLVLVGMVLAGCTAQAAPAPGAPAYGGKFPTTTGEIDTSLAIGGVSRTVFVYVPVTRAASPSLLVTLHGTGDPAANGLAHDMGSRFEALADAHGVVIVAPEARAQKNGDWDQHSGGEKYWETRPEGDPARGADPERNPDLLLVRAAIAEATRAYHVDPRRIYVAGFSNGALFSLHVAVTLRSQIAAFV